MNRKWSLKSTSLSRKSYSQQFWWNGHLFRKQERILKPSYSASAQCRRSLDGPNGRRWREVFFVCPSMLNAVKSSSDFHLAHKPERACRKQWQQATAREQCWQNSISANELTTEQQQTLGALVYFGSLRPARQNPDRRWAFIRITTVLETGLLRDRWRRVWASTECRWWIVRTDAYNCNLYRTGIIHQPLVRTATRKTDRHFSVEWRADDDALESWLTQAQALLSRMLLRTSLPNHSKVALKSWMARTFQRKVGVSASEQLFSWATCCVWNRKAPFGASVGMQNKIQSQCLQ